MTESHKPQRRDNAPLRVLLADGSPANGKRFREAMERLSFVEIVGIASNSEEALALFFRLEPAVVVVSVILAPQDGIEVLRCVKRAAPNCVVVLTSQGSQEFLERAGTLLGATAVCPAEDGCPRLGPLLQKLWSRG